jgi:hypothetical protein
VLVLMKLTGWLLLALMATSKIFTRLGMDKSVQVSISIVVQYSIDPKLF